MPIYFTKSIIYGGNLTMGHTHGIEVTESKGMRIGLLELKGHVYDDNIKTISRN